MSRKLYVRFFMLLAATFVPVVLEFGVVSYVVPSAYIGLFVGVTLFHAKFIKSLWASAHLAAYLLSFYAAARGTFWFSSLFKAPTIRSLIQVIVLLAVFSCSFIRAITYSSLQGQGGTYTFWGAVSRYLEKHHSQ